MACRIEMSEGACQKSEVAISARLAKMKNVLTISKGQCSVVRMPLAVGSVPLIIRGAMHVT